MNESDFRDRLKDALGEPPRTPPPVLSGRAAGAARTQPALLAVVAFAVAIALVLVLVVARISLHPTGSVLPAANPKQGPTPQAAAASFPCALPVTAVVEAGDPGQQGLLTSIAGFVNIPSGAFQVDPNARVSDLPGAGQPDHYSAALKRWLPSGGRAVSPDGRSYAHVTLLPAGATNSTFTSAALHVYNVSAKADRSVWTYAGSIDVLEWTSAGILVDTVPPRGGVRLLWRIEPTTGRASQQPPSADPSQVPPDEIPSGYHGFSYSGGDDGGHGLVRFGSRDPGAKYVVALDDNGRLTTIYSGVMGDEKDFDPGGMSLDAHGVWMSNFDGKYIWLWSQAAGLKSFTLSGGVPAPSGYQFTNVTYSPAGSCVPGTFAGTQASPLPAGTSPSPSPPPPAVDWSTLEAKPLHLDQLPAGAACPASSSVDLDVKAQSGKWPNYGFGPGPAYVSGQVTWYSAGSQAILILVDPKYQGPVLVRVGRIDGSGSAQITGDGLESLNDGYGLPQTSSPPYWGAWIGSITPSAPGCYGIQLDGTSFSVVDVIEVKQGPPPPG